MYYQIIGYCLCGNRIFCFEYAPLNINIQVNKHKDITYYTAPPLSFEMSCTGRKYK